MCQRKEGRGLETDLCGNRRPLSLPDNPDRLSGHVNLTEPLVSMDRYFVSNRTWNITTLGLLYRGRVGLSVVWVLTVCYTYVQRLEKFLIGHWSKKKKKERGKKRRKSSQRGFKQFYPERKNEEEGILCLTFFWKLIFMEFRFSFPSRREGFIVLISFSKKKYFLIKIRMYKYFYS